MHIKKIVELRPKGNTAADIQAAIDAASLEFDEAHAVLTDIEARRGDLLVGGSAKEIEAQDRVIQDLTRYLSDLLSFRDALATPLAAAKERERISTLRAEYDSLDAMAKIEAFSTAWRTTYLGHAQAIAALLTLEAAAHDAFHRAQRVAAKLVEAGVDMPDLVRPAVAAVGPGGLRGTDRLGNMVRLPGLHGGPANPIDMSPEYQTIFVERPDWDDPRGYDNTGKPKKTKIVEERRLVSASRPIRDDVAIWWPAEAFP